MGFRCIFGLAAGQRLLLWHLHGNSPQKLGLVTENYGEIYPVISLELPSEQCETNVSIPS